MSARTDIKADKAELERRAKRLKDAQDRFMKWREKADYLDALIRVQGIKLIFPHLSTNPHDLDAEIAKELKRRTPTPLP